MKKLGMFLMLVVAMAVAMPTNTYAQLSNMKPKEIKKLAKKKAKFYEKNGWEIYNSTLTIEVALIEHYNKMTEDGVQQIVGVASAFKSKNVGKQSALNSAINEYARQAQSFVRGRVITDIFHNPDDVPEEFDKFYAAYESMVVKEINGELRPSFSLIRSRGKDKNGNETFEMETYCIVNEAEASRARLRAMENALEESILAEEYASKVAGFIREGFNLKETGDR